MSLNPAWSTELVAGQAPKATKKLCPEKQTEKPNPNKQPEQKQTAHSVCDEQMQKNKHLIGN